MFKSGALDYMRGIPGLKGVLSYDQVYDENQPKQVAVPAAQANQA